MLNFLNLIKLLINNTNLLLFFIFMFLFSGYISKDYKSSLHAVLIIVVALSAVHLI